MKFQLGGEARLAKPTLQLRKIKKVFTNFLRGFWCFQQNFNGSKIVLSSSRGQGNFRGPKASRPRPRPRTGGFEAKAMAKDFKMCPRGRPRGQGRPRGLHLWLQALFHYFSHPNNRLKSFDSILLAILCFELS